MGLGGANIFRAQVVIRENKINKNRLGADVGRIPSCVRLLPRTQTSGGKDWKPSGESVKKAKDDMRNRLRKMKRWLEWIFF